MGLNLGNVWLPGASQKFNFGYPKNGNLENIGTYPFFLATEKAKF